MRTISQVVEDVMYKSPFYMEAFAEGIANNAELARRIKPDVEARLLEEVSEASIAMALHRMEKSVQGPKFGAGFLKRMSDITVRSSLVEFALPNSSDILDALKTLSLHAHQERHTFFSFSRGLSEVLVIVSADLADEVEVSLKNVRGTERLNGLSAITMRLPEESLAVPGVYAPILRVLAMEGISLVEVISVRTELTMIFENKDVDHAFSALKRVTS